VRVELTKRGRSGKKLNGERKKGHTTNEKDWSLCSRHEKKKDSVTKKKKFSVKNQEKKSVYAIHYESLEPAKHKGRTFKTILPMRRKVPSFGKSTGLGRERTNYPGKVEGENGISRRRAGSAVVQGIKVRKKSSIKEKDRRAPRNIERGARIQVLIKKTSTGQTPD